MGLDWRGMSRRWGFALAAMVCACVTTGDRIPPENGSEWDEVAVDDLHFIRAILRANHPGPVDSENPWFRDWYERGFTDSLSLARRADSYSGYFFAVTHYTIGFQDGHLGALGDNRFQETQLTWRWPSFVIGLSGEDFVVVESSPQAPPLGARLVSCDGRSVAALTDEIVRPYLPLWSVRGTRARTAPMLLIDEGNPFVRRPEQCTFEYAGAQVAHTLQWSPIEGRELEAKINAAVAEVAPDFAVRRFARGYWISLPSFALGDENVRVGMDRVVTAVAEQRETIRNAEIIVLDVRGNGGGSSRLGEDAAIALWGEAMVRSRPQTSQAVDWRVSPRNAAFLRGTNLVRLVQRYGENSPEAISYRTFVERMDAAVQRGDTFLRQANEGEDQRVAAPDANPVSARVFFLTDSACFSACLDFADLVLSIPAVTHVGAETRADAVYIDNRAERLPSGNGWFGFSMKVHRGRIRAHNQSYVPTRSWGGPMSDTQGLEEWIATLP